MGKEILNKRQINFLETLKSSDDLTRAFYLTGGTALAAFYLNHRESEDLDLFSEREVEPLSVEVFLKSKKDSLGFDRFEFQRSFNRNLFFLHYGDAAFKAEFTYFPFTRLEKGIFEGKLGIDSLRDIAVNKTFTISQQLRARDFIDLYFIVRKTGWNITSLLQDARVKFDTSIDLIQFGAQLIKVRELKDMPRMLTSLNFSEVEEFFLQEAAALKKDILF